MTGKSLSGKGNTPAGYGVVAIAVPCQQHRNGRPSCTELLPGVDEDAAESNCDDLSQLKEDHRDLTDSGQSQQSLGASANPVTVRARPYRRLRVSRSAALMGVVAVMIVVAWGAKDYLNAGAALTTLPPQPETATTGEMQPAAATPMPAVSASGISVGAVGLSPTGAAGLVVHVAGKVARPGTVTLTAGARVADAVAAAGGATRGAAVHRINLAQHLSDGEYLSIPGPSDSLTAVVAAGATAQGSPARRSDISTAAQGLSPNSGAGGRQVNLNSASADQLDSLPGIGPATAAKILSWRESHGAFSDIDELAEIPGIGPKTVERLRPLVAL